MNNLSKPKKNHISRNSKNVLIIDDKFENSDVIAFFLEAHGIGYKWISEGRKGLDTIKNEGGDFDLIYNLLGSHVETGETIVPLLVCDGKFFNLSSTLPI